MPENLTGADFEELEALQELTKIRGWRVFRNLLLKHKEYCRDKAHTHLRRHEDRKAGEWLARRDEGSVVFNLVDERRKQLSIKQKGENDGNNA